MRTPTKQVIAGVLGLSAADMGFWACFAPRSFYRSFPLPGHHWVAAMGPYNEHMTRDVGALYLALLVLSVWAVVRPRRETLAVAGAGWLAFSVPHFAFHLVHLDMYGAADRIGNVVTLGGTLVLAALLLWPASSADPPTDPAPARVRVRAARRDGGRS